MTDRGPPRFRPIADLPNLDPHADATMPIAAPKDVLDPDQLNVARALTLEMLRNPETLDLPYRLHDAAKLTLGNTADLVARLDLSISVVFKIDGESKVADEGKKLRQDKHNESLAPELRAALPDIYAIREQPPYGYMMESFPPPFVDFAKMLELPEQVGLEPIDRARLSLGDSSRLAVGRQPFAARRASQAISELLLRAWRKHFRNQPNLNELYLGRITERFAELEIVDPGRFKGFANCTLRIDTNKGTVSLPSIREMLEKLRGLHLSDWAPNFTTWVHGDLHPGNIKILDQGVGKDLIIKFFDPKEWDRGDYAWDAGKLLHYMLCTGPVEDSGSFDQANVAFVRNGNEVSLSHDLRVHPDVLAITKKTFAAAFDAFARENGDAHFRRRLRLSIAANLLGLQAGRIQRGKDTSALITLTDGLLWLYSAVYDEPSFAPQQLW